MSMYSKILYLVPALIPVLMILVSTVPPAFAESITASNAQELVNILRFYNVTIESANGLIVLKAPSTGIGMAVFNPVFNVVVYGIKGAKVAVVDTNNTPIVVLNGTEFDVVAMVSHGEVVYEEKLGTGALALIVAPNTTATIQSVEFSYPSKEALSAPAPPPGFVHAGSKSGKGSSTWTWIPPGKGLLWYAFKECDSGSCDYDLYIYEYTSGGKIKRDWDPGADDTWRTDWITISGSKIEFEVKDIIGLGKTWQVIWAFKSSGSSNPQPSPTHTPTPSPTPKPTYSPPNPGSPAAPIPKQSIDTKWILIGVGIVVVVIIIAIAVARR